MGPLIERGLLGAAALMLFAATAGPQQAKVDALRRTLFSQSAVAALQRKYGKSDVSYLVVDASSGAILASHWERPEKPIPMGSLVKPFAALAYAEGHDFRYPKYECRGSAGGCWQKAPHGELDLAGAISLSCNAYFRQLAGGVPVESARSVARRFALELPHENATTEDLFGFGAQWPIAPSRMALAYLELLRRKDAPGVSPILEGMRQSGRQGTGAAVGRQLHHSVALVKTGTATCTHARWAPADGFVLALVPAQTPEVLLLVRLHGVTGAKAAETAASILREMQE